MTSAPQDFGPTIVIRELDPRIHAGAECKARLSSSPNACGGGQPRICAVEGASAATLAAMLTPPPPCSAWSPSPLRFTSRGRIKEIRSRGAIRARGLFDSFAPPHRMIPKSGVRFSDKIMRNKEGSGAPRGASNQCPRHTFRCRHLNVRGARKRAINGSPLAFRRSTAALAKALTPWLSSRPCFLGRGPGGRYPPFPVPIQGLHLPHRP